MRRLTVVTWGVVGLVAGTGCQQKEEARPVAPSAAEGQTLVPPNERERVEARQRLREQADELADVASRTADAAGEVAKREAAGLDEQVEKEASRVHEELSEAARKVSEDARAVARDVRAEGSTAAERAVEDPLLGSVSGTVARASEGKLQLREADGKRIVLSTNDETRVVRGGQPASLEALQPGTEVRASYVIQGETWMAREVEVVPSSRR